MLTYVLFVIGLALLMFGGDWLVRGAVALAEKFGISPLIIGLTIVALGTSAPELLISLQAALQGSGGLAIGNVVGSNIANVLMVLGLPAFITAIHSPSDDLRPTLFFLTGLTVVFMLQLYNGPITYVDGILLLACLAAFLMQQYFTALREANGKAQLSKEDDYHDELGKIPTRGRVIAGFLIAGAIALPLGASFTVDAAVEIATRWQVPEAVIGLTIVAIGTSLPELATVVMAARHGNASVAVGNVIGSNLFNIAAIMGVTATIAGNVPVSQHILDFDMWVMLAATLFLFAMPALHLTINRRIGALLVTTYALYLVATAMF